MVRFLCILYLDMDARTLTCFDCIIWFSICPSSILTVFFSNSAGISNGNNICYYITLVAASGSFFTPLSQTGTFYAGGSSFYFCSNYEALKGVFYVWKNLLLQLSFAVLFLFDGVSFSALNDDIRSLFSVYSWASEGLRGESVGRAPRGRKMMKEGRSVEGCLRGVGCLPWRGVEPPWT